MSSTFKTETLSTASGASFGSAGAAFGSTGVGAGSTGVGVGSTGVAGGRAVNGSVSSTVSEKVVSSSSSSESKTVNHDHQESVEEFTGEQALEMTERKTVLIRYRRIILSEPNGI